ncbi:MAG: hypothetical protein HRU26_06580 [Psychroserpens sp.]|nr:hypothetical protein [Psychroserpens sp.]
MQTKVYRGIVREGYYGENWDALFIGENSQPIAEIFEEDFEAKQVTVRYWTSDEEKTKEEIQESVLRQLFGDVEANYNDDYSETTGYLWTDEDLNVGGHDLLEEIRSYLGKFIYLEVDVH